MRKIAIVGMADFTDEIPGDHEIWIIAEYVAHFERWGAAFECHEDISDRPDDSASMEFIRAPWKPFYTPNHLAHLYPVATPIPTDAMAEKYKRSYASSVSYMLACAIYEKVDEIALYGVDMALEDKYHTQRPSAYYWIGVANGLGIKTNGLIEEEMYGLKEDDHGQKA